jgi:hypothetical protein
MFFVKKYIYLCSIRKGLQILLEGIHSTNQKSDCPKSDKNENATDPKCLTFQFSVYR